MKVAYGFLCLFILFFVTASENVNKKALAENNLSGNITITLKNGVWKLFEEKPVYQNMEIPLVTGMQDLVVLLV
jgi:hypothetical protein